MSKVINLLRRQSGGGVQVFDVNAKRIGNEPPVPAQMPNIASIKGDDPTSINKIFDKYFEIEKNKVDEELKRAKLENDLLKKQMDYDRARMQASSKAVNDYYKNFAKRSDTDLGLDPSYVTHQQPLNEISTKRSELLQRAATLAQSGDPLVVPQLYQYETDYNDFVLNHKEYKKELGVYSKIKAFKSSVVENIDKGKKIDKYSQKRFAELDTKYRTNGWFNVDTNQGGLTDEEFAEMQSIMSSGVVYDGGDQNKFIQGALKVFSEPTTTSEVVTQFGNGYGVGYIKKVSESRDPGEFGRSMADLAKKDDALKKYLYNEKGIDLITNPNNETALLATEQLFRDMARANAPSNTIDIMGLTKLLFSKTSKVDFNVNNPSKVAEVMGRGNLTKEQSDKVTDNLTKFQTKMGAAGLAESEIQEFLYSIKGILNDKLISEGLDIDINTQSGKITVRDEKGKNLFTHDTRPANVAHIQDTKKPLEYGGRKDITVSIDDVLKVPNFSGDFLIKPIEGVSASQIIGTSKLSMFGDEVVVANLIDKNGKKPFAYITGDGSNFYFVSNDDQLARDYGLDLKDADDLNSTLTRYKTNDEFRKVGLPTNLGKQVFMIKIDIPKFGKVANTNALPGANAVEPQTAQPLPSATPKTEPSTNSDNTTAKDPKSIGKEIAERLNKKLKQR